MQDILSICFFKKKNLLKNTELNRYIITLLSSTYFPFFNAATGKIQTIDVCGQVFD